ncbi:MAG TPA: GNAT family N-acetyltransferase [Lachnospiraceae bacterium]|nr:GNAT family N-acetyltransferase [Lachnospiraceae bacterium]
MGIWALKKVVVVSDKKSLADIEKLSRSIQNYGITLCILPWIKNIDLQKEEGTLFVTDQTEIAAAMIVNGLPVLGCLTKSNRNAFFGGVKFLVIAEDELEPEYLERVYRRYCNLPWELLITERCLIRETIEADIDEFYEIYAHPSITRYTENLFPDREKERLYVTNYRKNVYEFYEYGIWTVVSKQTGKVIGRAGLTMREGFMEPELGFIIGASWQREGYAYEVCMSILSYGFKELGFQKVQAFTQPQNTASLGLMHKLGFQPVGSHVINGIEHIRLEKDMDSLYT